MNHQLGDVALGMILGYALARGLSRLSEHSALSGGADAMASRRTRRAPVGAAPLREGALYPGANSATRPAG